MQFDMNRTWSDALALVRRNFQLLAVIAGVFVLLPTLIFYIANPELLQAFALMSDPEAMDALLDPIIPRLLAFGLGVFLLQLIGYGAMVALISDGRPTVGEAIGAGARALLPALLAFIVFMIGLIVVGGALAFGVSLVVVLLATLFGSSAEAAAGFAALVTMPALLALQLYLMVRFMLTLPAIVIEGRRRPLQALDRSRRLTKPRAWAILGFIALLGVAYLVILMVIDIALNAVGAVAGGGSGLAFALVMSVTGALVAMLTSAILVSIHHQLAGAGEPADIEFDA